MYDINYFFFRVNRKVVKAKECKQLVLRQRLPRAHVLLECCPRTILKGMWSRTCLNHHQQRKTREIKIKLIEMTSGTEIVSSIDIQYSLKNFKFGWFKLYYGLSKNRPYQNSNLLLNFD